MCRGGTGRCVKNVIAIAAGISDGLGFGLNARAALVTRGLAELTRLGLHLGGHPEPSWPVRHGRPDPDCTGDLSRNRQLGLRLAAGESLEGALRELGTSRKGSPPPWNSPSWPPRCSRHAHHPAVAAILRGELPPREAVAALLARELKDEAS